MVIYTIVQFAHQNLKSLQIYQECYSVEIVYVKNVSDNQSNQRPSMMRKEEARIKKLLVN